jgi:hypothetical protein
VQHRARQAAVAAAAAFHLVLQLQRRSFDDEILVCSELDAGCEEAAVATLRAAAAAPPPALEGACRALLGAYAAAAHASGGAAASLSEYLQTLASLISGGFPSRWALAGSHCGPHSRH